MCLLDLVIMSRSKNVTNMCKPMIVNKLLDVHFCKVDSAEHKNVNIHQQLRASASGILRASQSE